jgi:hypothetical protein
LYGRGIALAQRFSEKTAKYIFRRRNMLKKICSVLVITLLMQAAIIPISARTNFNKEADRLRKVHDQIVKHGIGTEARVKIELLDKTTIKGYISKSGADNFTVVDSTGRATEIEYSQVKKVYGRKLSTGSIIAISAGAAAAFTLFLIYHAIAVNER